MPFVPETSPLIGRIRYFLAHGDWKFLAGGVALVVVFEAVVPFVHV